MNRLRQAASPYLRQHADNPVHWREWGAEALAEARARDAPICLSIGYAACHWCHVMAHESFEDEATAAVMNEGFVNVKVDREERPDVDQIYMNALQALGEQGGWPLTMFLDPEGRPFWGGTYFPPEPRYGRPGFREVLEAVRKTWDEDRGRIEHNAGGLLAHLRRTAAVPDEASAPIDLDAFAERLLDLFDAERGGLRGAPKFPQAPMTETLFRAWRRTGDVRYRSAFRTTLRAMAQGGIYDHVGGGLTRYSTDARWLVPHFEKMLYDNAHFVRQAAWMPDDPMMVARVGETIAWLLREMWRPAPEHGFAASLDADTPTPDGNVEGLTYTWTPDEVKNVLGERASSFLEAYNMAGGPTFEGRFIPHRNLDDPLPDEGLRADLERLRRHRDTRTQPARDGKVLTDWNMMLAQAVTLAGISPDRRDEDAVGEALETYRRTGREGVERLAHSAMDDRFVRPALLSDHVERALACVHFHAVGVSVDLRDALDHLREIEAHYLVDGLPVLTHDEADDLLVRPSAFQDDPNPSPASRLSVLLTLLDALGALPDHALKDRLEAALAAHLTTASFGAAGAANALDMARSVSTLTLHADGDATAWRSVVAAHPDPSRLLLLRERGRPEPDDPDWMRAPPGTDGNTIAILCRNHACLPPARTPNELRDLLNEG